MKSRLLVFFTIQSLFISNVWSITLEQASDRGTPGVFNYDVLFTNPVCDGFEYEVEIKSEEGELLTKKPVGAWCSKSSADASGARESSPQNRLVKIINDPTTKEIFLTYLSFSNGAVTDALVENIESRDLKVTLMFDHPAFGSGIHPEHFIPAQFMERSRTALKASDLEDQQFFNYVFKKRNENFNAENPNSPRWVNNYKVNRPLQILQAESQTEANSPTLYLRGHDRSTLGYAHNKLIIVNPNDPEKITLVFSSGNMSSGAILHHENWHFVTLSPKTYFAQAHMCLMNGMIDHGLTKNDFVRYIKSCRRDISYDEESDIKTFFVPGEGDAAFEQVKAMINRASKIDMAAHRFSHSGIINLLEDRIEDDGLKFRLIADDDMYWAKFEYRSDRQRHRFPNNAREYNNVKKLLEAGEYRRNNRSYNRAKVQFVQTSHWSRLLHHNKFILERNRWGTVKSVFCGAGNFTKAAFSKNYENFYYITITSVRTAFAEQYDYLWEISSTHAEMPERNIKPNGDNTLIQ